MPLADKQASSLVHAVVSAAINLDSDELALVRRANYASETCLNVASRIRRGYNVDNPLHHSGIIDFISMTDKFAEKKKNFWELVYLAFDYEQAKALQDDVKKRYQNFDNS